MNYWCTPLLTGWLVLALLAGPAHAIDGLIEINDASAQAGGVTPGDLPGYPVTLDQPGSYRLTGNLGTSGTNLDVVEITTDDVTLDLNGFTIRCLYVFNPCVGTGIGVDAGTQANVTLRNGTVRDMGGSGVILSGNDNRVTGVQALSNGGNGVAVGAHGTVTNVLARSNGLSGIFGSTAATITGSTAAKNGVHGISGSVSTRVTGNTSFDNDSGFERRQERIERGSSRA